jgi:hypothetical protein
VHLLPAALADLRPWHRHGSAPDQVMEREPTMVSGRVQKTTVAGFH